MAGKKERKKERKITYKEEKKCVSKTERKKE